MMRKLANPTSNVIILSSSCVNIVHSVNFAKWILGQVFFLLGFGPPYHAKTLIIVET
jgi:hypothetical protein